MRFKFPVQHASSLPSSTGGNSVLGGQTRASALAFGVSGAMNTGVQAVKIIKQNDERKIISFENKMYVKYKDISQQLQQDGNYKGALESWDSYLDTTRNDVSQDLSFLGKKAFKVAENLSVLTYNDKLENQALDLQKQDLISAIELNMKILTDKAVEEGVPNQKDVQSIIANVETLPGFVPNQKVELVQKYVHDYYFDIGERKAKEDPEGFLQTRQEWEGGLNSTEIFNLQNLASGTITRNKNIQDQLNKDSVGALSLQMVDQVSSILVTGTPVNKDLILNLRELGAEQEASDLERDESTAYELYNKFSQLEAVPLLQRKSELNKLKPDPGEENYAKEENFLSIYSDELKEKIEKFKADPVEYLHDQIQQISDTTKVDPVTATIQAQLNQGVPENEIRFFTNEQKTSFENEWKTRVENREELITEILTDVPQEYKGIVVAQLPIESISKLAYRLTESSYDRQLMLSSIQHNTYSKNLNTEQRKQIDWLLNSNDDSLIDYYKNIAATTGSPEAVNMIPELLSLAKHVSSYHYLIDDNTEDVNAKTNQTMFGLEQSFVSSDLVLAQASEDVLDLLSSSEDLLIHFRETMPSTKGKDPLTISRIKSGGGKWLLEKGNLFLYDPILRKKVIGKHGEDIIIPINDLENLLLEFKESKRQKYSPFF